jgi:murein DD-endopeptidase MepM/ murein hydrolase activator NlpD
MITWMLLLLLPLTTGQEVTEDVQPIKPVFVSPIHGSEIILMSREYTHQALDFPAPMGTPVHAIADGTVKLAKWKPRYGKVIFVQHENGIQSRYAHCDRFLVEKGDEVKKNQIIGTIGLTGRTTGPHLHFEIWENFFEDSPYSQPSKLGPFEIIETIGLHTYRWIGRLKDQMIKGNLPGQPNVGANSGDETENDDQEIEDPYRKKSRFAIFR